MRRARWSLLFALAVRLAAGAVLCAAEEKPAEGTIGAQLGARDGGVVLEFIFPGAPADKAGLKAGDRIVAVDGRSVRGLATEAVAGRIRGPAGAKVEITIENKAGELRSVSVERVTLPPARGPEDFVGEFFAGGSPQLRVTITKGEDGLYRAASDTNRMDAVGILYRNPTYGTWHLKGVMQARDVPEVDPAWRGLVGFFELACITPGVLQSTQQWALGEKPGPVQRMFLVRVPDQGTAEGGR